MDVLITAIAIAALAISTAGVCIAEIVVHPTLKRYGVNRYSRGWHHASSWIWVLKYKEVCTQHGLSLRYWNMLQLCVWSAGVLVTVWLALVVVQFWRDLVR
jgi:hypothetical protein